MIVVSITLGTQLEPRHGLMWCLVAVGIVMLLPTFHAVRTAKRRRGLGGWIAAGALALVLVALPLGAASGLAVHHYYVSDSAVSISRGDRILNSIAFADVDRIELERIGGFRGATLVDRDAAGGPQEFSLTWATADLRPLIDVLDEEIARRPALLGEDDRETWREDYLSRD